MRSELLGALDGWAGSRIERAMGARHRRRLRRAGRLAQLDPPQDGSLWCAGDPSPRSGCELELLIDGAQALPRIAEALQQARSHVHIAGWHLTPGFGLTRTADARRLRDVLGELAFVGGIDLTSLAGDRYDSNDHPRLGRLGWHDAASRLRGPAVADVAEHFAARWHAVTGERLPEAPVPAPAGSHEVQVVRTLPERVYDFAPTGDFRILEAYTRALRTARRLVYLESQFLWSPQVVEILAAKLREPPSQEFRVVVLLPAKPNNGADTTRGQLGVLVDADAGAGRFLATTISARTGELIGPLYVHAKIAIVDDSWLTIGSANLNEHSFFNDSEMNLIVCDPELARETRLRLWAEHLERPVEDVSGQPAEVIDTIWQPVAKEQLERARRGDPRSHHLQQLPGVSRRTMALMGPLTSLLVDG